MLIVGANNEVIRLESTDTEAFIHLKDSTGSSFIKGRGDLRFEVGSADVVQMLSTETVINTSSNDYDFRVESNGNTHMLFVDGGNDRVGIGVDAPSDVFQVHSGAAGRSIFRHASGDGGVTITGTGAGSAASLVFGNNWDNDAGSNFVEEYRLFMDGADDSLKFNYNANSSTALTLSSSGAATFTSSVTATKGIFTQAGGDFAAVFTTPFDYVAKFESTDSAAFIVLEDVNSTDNANRIGAVGDSIQIESGNVENALFTSTASVFNENSADMDFRVESDSNASMLFVDAGNNRVGVGVGSPQQALDVNGYIKSTPNTADTNYSMEIGARYDSAFPFSLAVKNNGTQLNFIEVKANSGGGSERLIFPNGNVSVGDQTAPTAKLTVSGDNNGAINLLQLRNSDSTYSQSFDFELGTAKNMTVTGASGNGGYRFNGGTNGFVINETSNDMDFRVESNGNANAILVDAGANRLNIFGASGSSTVDIVTGNGSAGDSVLGVSIKGADTNLTDKLNLGVNTSSSYAFINAVRPGTNNIPLHIQPLGAGVVFNENGAGNGSVRMESDNNVNAFRLDAGGDSVGIGLAPGTGATALYTTGITLTSSQYDLALGPNIDYGTASAVQGGSIDSLVGMSTTTRNGSTFEFEYYSTSWKAYQYEIHIMHTAGMVIVHAGGYQNSGAPSQTVTTEGLTSSISSATVTSTSAGGVSNQSTKLTITLSGAFTHPCIRIKYSQSGGDGIPRGDRLHFTYNY